LYAVTFRHFVTLGFTNKKITPTAFWLIF